VSAAIKKKSDLVFGNIIGSNIFNILFVLGIAGMVGTIPFDSKFVSDSLIATSVAILLWLVTFRKRQLTRWAGVLFVLLYAIYVCFIVV
jgi:cation:H+ antiporter